MSSIPYRDLVEAGWCGHCGVRLPVDGQVLCAVCAEANIDRTAARKARRLKDGKCPHCGGDPTPGYKTCAAWREADKRYHRRSA